MPTDSTIYEISLLLSLEDIYEVRATPYFVLWIEEVAEGNLRKSLISLLSAIMRGQWNEPCRASQESAGCNLRRFFQHQRKLCI